VRFQQPSFQSSYFAYGILAYGRYLTILFSPVWMNLVFLEAQFMHAFVFPGQGTQKVGMGADLFEEFQELTAEADSILGYSIRTMCLEGPLRLLNQTAYTQPIIYIINALHYLRFTQSQGATPHYFAGFSLGEYNALQAGGAFDFITGLQLVKARAEFMSQIQGGAMAAVVGPSESDLRALLEQYHAKNITISNYNSPDQHVISGSNQEISRLNQAFNGERTVEAFVPLRTSGAFHSPFMKDAADRFEQFLEKFEFFPLSTPVIANATAEPYGDKDVKALLVKQIAHPVRWSDSIRYLLRLGVTDFTEIGEGKILTGMIDRIQRCYFRAEAEGVPTAPVLKGNASAAPSLLNRIMDKCTAVPDKLLQVFHTNDRIEPVTGGQIADEVARLGSALIDRLPPQENVVLLLPHSFDYTKAILSCWHAKLVAIPTPISDAQEIQQKQEALQTIVKHSGARFILTNTEFANSAKSILENLDAEVLNADDMPMEAGVIRKALPVQGDNLALLLYTSGSTAQPKGVMIDHATACSRATSEQWGLSEHSRVVSWLPLHHAFGINLGFLAPLAKGALCVSFAPDEFVASPLSWFELIDRYQATHTGAPSFAFELCASSIADADVSTLSLASLQCLICGGDVIRKSAYERFASRFAPAGLRPEVLAPHYGLSEAAPVTLKRMGQSPGFLELDADALHDNRVRLADHGRPIASCGESDASTQIVIADSEGRPCSPDAIGEIWIKTPYAAQGYWRDAAGASTAFDAVLQDTGEGGFLRTGDLGFVVQNNLYIVGREKELIIVNGKNYYPSDIIATLKDSVNGVEGHCAFISCDVDDVQRLIAIIEFDEHAATDKLKAVADEIVNVISYKYQLSVHDVLMVRRGAIPTTPSNKIQKKRCEELYLRNEFAPLWRRSDNFTTEPPSLPARMHNIPEVISKIKQYALTPELGPDAIRLGDDDAFSHMGLDSIRYIRIARKIKQVFGIECRVGLLYANNTCRKLARYILAQKVGEGSSTAHWDNYADERVSELLSALASGQSNLSQTLKLLKERL
jgi:malonyl CoA-acyl carrier protein transacylase